MRKLETDLSILRKFEFEHAPVGVKFLFSRPEGIENARQAGRLLRHDPDSPGEAALPSTSRRRKRTVSAGSSWGWKRRRSSLRPACWATSSASTRSRARTSASTSTSRDSAKGTVNYAAFSVLDALTFEPDLLILMATPSQAEIVLRAMSYSTGELWESKKTPVLSCAWIFAYPWLTGKVNHMITGMGFGSRARQAPARRDGSSSPSPGTRSR